MSWILDVAIPKFNRIAQSVSKLIAIISYTGLSIAAIGTLADVGGRYLFDRPILGVIELNTIIMPIIVYCSLGITQIRRGHISIDFITTNLKPNLKIKLEIFHYLLGFVFVFVFAWTTWQSALASFRFRESMLIGMETFPIWWAKFFIPIGLWVFAVQYLADIGMGFRCILRCHDYETKARQ